jgi:hypothetical protein
MALLIVNPGFSLCSNPGLKLANAFGVKFKLRHHHRVRARHDRTLKIHARHLRHARAQA